MTPRNHPITDQLRSEAQSYDPAPPAHLNRRIRSALAALPDHGETSRAALLLRFQRPIIAATVLASALLLATLVYRRTEPTPKIAQTPTSKSSITSTPTFASARLDALTYRWVEQPLEGEVTNLLTDLTRTKETVARVLPAAAKRAKPATTTGAPPQGA